MVEITKNEAKELIKAGVKHGNNGISHSGTRRKLYLCESPKNMSLLKKIRG